MFIIYTTFQGQQILVTYIKKGHVKTWLAYIRLGVERPITAMCLCQLT